MKKLYTLFALAMMGLGAQAQEANDTTYVTMLFDANPWNYGVSEVTKGWSPDLKDWDAPGAIMTDTDFSWPISEESTAKVKVTVYSVDLDEYEQVPMLGRYELNDAEAAGLGIEPGARILLYATSGTTMRFETPEGYNFGKMVFYNFRSSNFMVGDEYDEDGYEYTYNGNTFKQKLKVWKPDTPKQNQYGAQIWEGDEKNIHLNYPSFSACFAKIDIRLVPDGTAGIHDIQADGGDAKVVSLDGRTIGKGEPLRKGIYIVGGKKRVIH